MKKISTSVPQDEIHRIDNGNAKGGAVE